MIEFFLYLAAMIGLMYLLGIASFHVTLTVRLVCGVLRMDEAAGVERE